MAQYTCIKDVFSPRGEKLASKGDVITLELDSADRGKRKAAEAVFLTNGRDDAFREYSEPPKASKPRKSKKKASYKTRQATPEEAPE